jgi:hypothetical protein
VRLNVKKSKLGLLCNKLRRDQSGLALVEFAVSLPFFMGLTISGVEMANYASVVMQINQITIHTADGAARMGQNSLLAVRPIDEALINDVFEGTLREGDRIALAGKHIYTDPKTNLDSIRGNARIILSSIETDTTHTPANPKYRIRWQRCAGSSSIYKSSYGTPSSPATSKGIGPSDRPIKPPEGNAVMMAEVRYFFQPLILNGFSKLTDRTISQVSSMIVREKRDYAGPRGGDGVYQVSGVTPSTCN